MQNNISETSQFIGLFYWPQSKRKMKCFYQICHYYELKTKALHLDVTGFGYFLIVIFIFYSYQLCFCNTLINICFDT